MLWNYLDKVLVFIGPLLVLLLGANKTTYNQIEYVYAIAPVIAVMLDGNLRTYFLQAYREADNRTALVGQVRGYFQLQLFASVALVAVVLGAWGVHGAGLAIAYGCGVRALYLLAQSFYQRYFRLCDAPSRAFAFSVTGGGATVAVVAVFWALGRALETWHFFLAQVVVVTLACAIGLNSLRGLEWTGMKTYFYRAFVYGWPVMLNVLAMLLLNNVGKIYAFSAMTSDQMFRLALVQRGAMIVPLTHAGMIGFMEKRLFLDDSIEGAKRAFIGYASVLLASAAVVLAALAILARVSDTNAGPIDIVTASLLLATVLWCFVSYGELLMLKYHFQKLVPVFSGAGFLVTVALLALTRSRGLTGVALSQFSGVAVTLVCMAFTLLRRMRLGQSITATSEG